MAGRISGPISGLIGLGQEIAQHRKDQKAAAQAKQDKHQVDVLTELPAGKETLQVESSDDEDDEELWLEDDAQDTIKPQSQHKSSNLSVKEWVDSFVERHPWRKAADALLPAPVLLPQKRPGSRTRGFVRAYAPALEGVTVDQTAWLEFVEGFQNQYGKQGYFHVTNIAVALSVLAYTVSVAPSIVVHATALAVHTSIEAGRRMYISKKSNSYLDEMNVRYFQPRGLYAMIMTYDSSTKDASALLDFETFSTHAIEKHTREHQSTFRSFQASSGKTVESQFPDVCPLVFPDVENAMPEQRDEGFKAAVRFARDYYDRRSQATFAAQNPDSKLAVEQKQFGGKYGDPITFQHSGLIGVLTGGAIDPRRKRFERRQKRKNLSGQQGSTSGQRGVIRPAIQGMRKALGERVLYLLVVNMPSEEDMRIASEMEAKMKADEPNWFEKYQMSARSV